MRDELKGDIAELRTELKGDIARLERRVERLEDQMEQLRSNMQSQLRWTMSLLIPIVLGVVALLMQNLFLSP